jgi:hypothetical protein
VSAGHVPAVPALLAYLVTVCLGGLALRHETTARRRLDRQGVIRRIRAAEADPEAMDIIRTLTQVDGPALSVWPALRLVRGGVR